MAKFVFRLQRVLKYRNIVLEEKKRELGLALGRKNEIEAKINWCESEVLKNALPLTGMIQAGQLTLVGDYAGRLLTEIGEQRLALIEANDKVEAARELYKAALMEVKVLEKLREKQLVEFKMEQDKKQQLEMEELFIQRVHHIKE